MLGCISHVCCRVGDPRWKIVPGSLRRRCSKCKHAIWASQESIGRTTGFAVTLICIECAAAQAKRTGNKFVPLPLSSSEIEAAIAATRPRNDRN